MTKKELAARWHISVRAINRLIHLGEIESFCVLNSQNVRNLIDISLDEIARYEKWKHIPKDPINMREALQILNVDINTLGYFKTYMHHVGSINLRLFLFSKAEIMRWKFFLGGKELKHVIVLKEDLVIPSGTRFYPYAKSIKSECYIGDVAHGSDDAAISVTVDSQVLKEVGNKFGLLVETIKAKGRK